MVVRRGSTVYASTAAGSRIIVMRQSVPRDGGGQGLEAVFAASSRERGLGQASIPYFYLFQQSDMDSITNIILKTALTSI